MSEARRATVAELQAEGILLVEDGNHGEHRPRPDEFVDSGVAFIRAADMDGGRVLFESASRINDRARERITKGIGAPGDILLSHKGTVGKVAMVPPDALPFVCSPQTTFWRTLRPELLDRHYLYAYLRSAQFHRQLASRAGETDMAPYVSLTAQRQLDVVLPPIAEQRRIALILGALDDKIELNRRMSSTIESMSRALFRSWFVDFDPVRAQAEGRDPDFPANVVDLFPNRLIESALGAIPHGWTTAGIYDIAEVVYGAPFSSALFNDQRLGRPLIRIRDLVDQEPAVWTTEEPSRGYIVRAGEIIVGMDGEFRAYLWHGSDAWLNQRVCVFKPKPGFPAAFVRGSIEAPLASVEASETATTVIHLGKADIDTFRLVLPPDHVIARFRAIVEPLYERVVAARREAAHLATLRSALLPHLLTGSRTAEADA